MTTGPGYECPFQSQEAADAFIAALPPEWPGSINTEFLGEDDPEPGRVWVEVHGPWEDTWSGHMALQPFVDNHGAARTREGNDQAHDHRRSSYCCGTPRRL
jgi:hypothetical protein